MGHTVYITYYNTLGPANLTGASQTLQTQNFGSPPSNSIYYTYIGSPILTTFTYSDLTTSTTTDTILTPTSYSNKQTTLKSVAISLSVTSIANNCFKNCILLTSVTIPTSISSLGISSFESKACGAFIIILFNNWYGFSKKKGWGI